MAVAVIVRIAGAGRDDHDRLQDAINGAIDASGGPPEGLLVHSAHEDGDGFVIVDVFSNEASYRSFESAVLEPALASTGLAASPAEVRPVWSLARP